MKAEALRQLTPEELGARIREFRNELFNLKVKHSTGQLESPISIGTARRDLARALTVQSEREREV